MQIQLSLSLPWQPCATTPLQPVLCLPFSKQDNQHDLLHVCVFRCDYFQGPFNLPLTLFSPHAPIFKKHTYHLTIMPGCQLQLPIILANCCFCSSSLMSDPKWPTCNSQAPLFHVWMDFHLWLQTFVFWCFIPLKQSFYSDLGGVRKQPICKWPDLVHFLLHKDLINVVDASFLFQCFCQENGGKKKAVISKHDHSCQEHCSITCCNLIWH